MKCFNGNSKIFFRALAINFFVIVGLLTPAPTFAADNECETELSSFGQINSIFVNTFGDHLRQHAKKYRISPEMIKQSNIIVGHTPGNPKKAIYILWPVAASTNPYDSIHAVWFYKSSVGKIKSGN